MKHSKDLQQIKQKKIRLLKQIITLQKKEHKILEKENQLLKAKLIKSEKTN